MARKTSTFWYYVSKAIFAVAGWRLASTVPPGIPKSMMIAAPHTSNWDFIMARAAFYLMDVDVRFTVKKEWTDIPVLGGLMKALGALAVDRSKNNSLVDGMVQLFEEREELVILITPEGTRAYQPKWRKGFYFAALGAGVPILLGYLDYARKEAGVGPAVYPTGNYEADLEQIQAFYRTKKGRFPQNGVR
ncbi:1-acyl-sn-glycerol-3-phosphate acyltransferase [Hymenobacter weizhouensis]|uniref:1-acyl-sn-glycerol-3-phosphate acyltransferase n=1 Tax=Hymenobacter sp. YIM 151500-1 TaxID=2987689 RepID=UPI002226042B|nr:1-acyl-sn-glycerol-3-phosphate acyltransferase [Hymenobacter sp. YIM 151500-1]UYZ63915.1 1-acyl-sn-glycerol-3-phosphate acyltransferase [Hymenobacter sp. YIM 151500-1]